MAEVLHQSKVVQPSKQLDSKETLVRFLDNLLERYLHLLDRHQSLQQSLTQCLSNVRNVLAILHVLKLPRGIYYLRKPTIQIQIMFATARNITMIGCRHRLMCTLLLF